MTDFEAILLWDVKKMRSLTISYNQNDETEKKNEIQSKSSGSEIQ